MRGGAVDRRIAAATPLVRHWTAIAETGQDQTVLDPAQVGLVSREPRDRTDGSGEEQEAIGEGTAFRHGPPGQLDRHRERRQIVVREGGMAGMTGDEDLVGRGSRHQILPVRK